MERFGDHCKKYHPRRKHHIEDRTDWMKVWNLPCCCTQNRPDIVDTGSCG